LIVLHISANLASPKK